VHSIDILSLDTAGSLEEVVRARTPESVTCPAPRRHKAKKTQSACELVASAAGSNIYTLTESKQRVYLYKIQSLIAPPPCLLVVLELMQILFRRLNIIFF
jgi:hypothetical protein